MESGRNIQTKLAILEAIKKYDTIIIARHQRPDGDAIGSSQGLAEILRESFPEKKIIVSNQDTSEYMAFLGTVETAPDDISYQNALAIVTDTAGLERCANTHIQEAEKLIKIDH
ncbi:MAG: hypothetical protein IJM73_02755, partial [Spirochaetales bacterium]|nr:hypothetical protein [Spirochaetales bacterium]